MSYGKAKRSLERPSLCTSPYSPRMSPRLKEVSFESLVAVEPENLEDPEEKAQIEEMQRQMKEMRKQMRMIASMRKQAEEQQRLITEQRAKDEARALKQAEKQKQKLTVTSIKHDKPHVALKLGMRVRKITQGKF